MDGAFQLVKQLPTQGLISLHRFIGTLPRLSNIAEADDVERGRGQALNLGRGIDHVSQLTGLLHILLDNSPKLFPSVGFKHHPGF
jgi:hypothetical protein